MSNFNNSVCVEKTDEHNFNNSVCENSRWVKFFEEKAILTIVCGNGWLHSHLEAASDDKDELWTILTNERDELWRLWLIRRSTSYAGNQQRSLYTSYYLQQSGEQLSSIASSVDSFALKQVEAGTQELYQWN